MTINIINYKLFCNDDLWNSNTTWSTNNPKLTKCLANVGFTIIPSLIFTLIIAIEINIIFKSKNKKISHNKYNISRQLICLFAVISNLYVLVNYIYALIVSNSVQYTLSDLLASISKLSLYVLFMIIYYYSRLNGVITSGNMFTIHFLSVIVFSTPYLDSILYNKSMYTYFEKNNFNHLFLCNICLFALSCISDDCVEAGLKSDSNDETLLNNIESDDYNEYDEKKAKISPRVYSSFLSHITFYWYTEFFKILKRKKTIQFNDVFDLEDNMKIELVSKEFNDKFFKEMNRINEHNNVSDKKINYNAMSMLKVIWKTFGNQILFAFLLKFLTDIIELSTPVLLGLMIRFINDPNELNWHGAIISTLFVSASILKNLFSTFHTVNINRVGFNIKSCLTNLLFSKSLKLSPQAKNKRTTGEIINLCSVDAGKLTDFSPFMAYIWSAPLQIILALYLLHRQLGNSVFVGLLIIIVMMYLQFKLSGYRHRCFGGEMKIKDERIKLTNEILTGIKVIKLSGLEFAFQERINKERDKEIGFIKKTYTLDMFNWFFFSLSPNLVLISTFSIYLFFIDSTSFTSEKVFVSIAIFNILGMPLEVLPTLISYLAQCKVSMQRISTFLAEEELDGYVTRNIDNEFALKIEDLCNFAWGIEDQNECDTQSNSDSNTGSDTTKKLDESDEIKKSKKRFKLKDIEFGIKKNSFTAIIGQVGSGKSSLISAILGDMHLIENDLGVKGKVNISEEQSICYVAQQAWIQNASLKDNILFGKKFNAEQYEDVIRSCALEPDLNQFEDGDETEIGEKGINLSGGQKQRVSLARACYQSISTGNRNKMILLDDPLSAVDAHVGKHLCENVLSSRTGLLKDTTRILVTNQLNQLSDLNVDQIILLKDGKIELKCTYDELLELDKNGQLDEYNLRLSQNEQIKDSEKINEDKESEISEIKTKDEKKISKKLIEKEEIKEGRVEMKNYKVYFNYFGYFYIVIVLGLLIFENFFQLYSRVYLADWTNTKLNSTDKNYINNYNRDHILIFGGLTLSQCIFNLIINFFILLGTLSTVRLFHLNLLYSILRSPMSFFDKNPLGRILNRFSKDIDSIDHMLPVATREFLMYSFKLLASIAILIFKQPGSFIWYLLVFVLYYFITEKYITTSRQLKRFDSVTRSPIYSHISEVFQGISTIRAYKKIEHFERECRSKINLNMRAFWYYLQGPRWLNFNLNLLASLVLFVITMQAIIKKETTNAGDVGLVISYALSLLQLLSYTIRLINMFETNAVSVERINYYIEDLEEEDEWIKDNRPPLDWPKNGEIKFIDYSTRYRENTNLILKKLNFKVDKMEKIGVVGRTGAGKSTIALALFRIIEPVEGKIIIDNIDIGKIGLHDLRSKLSIIPQDPVLFTGTIRFNLDPLDKYSDKEIFESLEHAHLKQFVNSLEDGILHKISEGGENLSVGQRQLICLARALLRKSKILVLDEATASVDFATDELVQKTIRSEFKDCTIITIAHRLNTVLDSNRILVLDKGELKEYDKPDTLLENQDSIFYHLALKANIVRRS